MNSDIFGFHSSEYMDSNSNSQYSDDPFQPSPNSILDESNCLDHFSFANHLFRSPLPLGSVFGGSPMSDSYNSSNKETNASSGGVTYSAEMKCTKRYKKKAKTTFGNRSSMYRGVTRYENGRCEAFVWDNTDPQGKPKTTYVGGFEQEEEAARAYDLAALKLWGAESTSALNFPVTDYEKDLEEMKSYSKKDYLLRIRRSSSRFANGISHYRGVSKNADYKKWQARLGKGRDICGIYLGTFDTEEEAARAYDVAAIRVRGKNAVTNFDISQYDIQAILSSNKVPIGKGASKTLLRTSVDEVLRRSRRTKKKDQTKIQTQKAPIGSNSHNYPTPIFQYSTNPSSQLPDPHRYQITHLQQNPSFSPWINNSGGEKMEPLVDQYKPIIPSENYESQLKNQHMYQNPSSFRVQESHNPNSLIDSNFLNGWKNVASDNYVKGFNGSQVQKESMAMMGMNEDHDDGRDVVLVGNSVDQDFGVGKSDHLVSSNWMDMFLMSSDGSDLNV